MKIKSLFVVVFIVFFFACSSDDGLPETNTGTEQDADDETTDEPADNDTSDNPNILLIIADDMGLDASPGYSIGATKPNMPTLQSMINSGITFNNVWAYPTCTPTRASILTGKYGFRTNVLKVDDVLATSETSIQKYLDENTNDTYSHAVIGKWHLSKDSSHPTAMGIDYYAGFLSGGVQDYSNWSLIEDGNTSTSTEYTTTKFTDLAIDWVDDQTKPWFLWLAYNAPHTPFHLPPTGLHSQGALADDQSSIDANPTPYYMAALEAMDSEMGRFLNSMTQEEKDNTLILFIGDNGTPNQVRQEYPNRRVKGTVYQGGVNVPMVISGATVSRMNETEDALVGTADLFATIADVAGTSTTEINDSRSFKALFDGTTSNNREYIYSEVGYDLGGSDKTIRNDRYKYILFSDGDEALFDLSLDALEDTNLLNANQLPLSDTNSAEKDKLTAELALMRN